MKMIELSEIDLNLLVAFAALYEERSVTAAANRIYIGQPAMSAALGRLRSLFDDELFVRVGREMKPTIKAEGIAPQIIEVLKVIHSMFADLQAFNPATAKNTFSIATSDYFASLVLPELMRVLQREAPHVNLCLLPFSKETLVYSLEKGEVSLALGTFSDLPSHIVQETLFPERFVGMARKFHPAIISATQSLSLEDFVQFPHCLFTLRRDAIGIIDQELAKKGLKRRIALTVPYWFAIPSAIIASDFLVAVPSCMATYLNKHFDLQSFEIPLNLDTWAISMVWSRLTDRDPAHLWLRQTIVSASNTVTGGCLLAQLRDDH